MATAPPSNPYDPKLAKQLLAQAGYPNGFAVKFHGSVGRYTKDKEIEEAIIGQLADVGVKAQLEILEAGVFIQSFLGGTIGPLWIWAWQYLPAMDADLPLNFFQTRSIARQMANPEYDALVASPRRSSPTTSPTWAWARQFPTGPMTSGRG